MRARVLQVVVVVAGAGLGLGSYCQVSKTAPPPPKTILDTPQSPRSFTGDFASRCGGQKFPRGHEIEWEPMVGGVDETYAVTGLSGSVVEATCAGTDFIYTHPMGMDWETFISVDRQYQGLLAPTNWRPEPGDELVGAQKRAAALGLSEGILGTEIEQGMSQPRYRACPPEGVPARCPSGMPSPRDCTRRRPGTADRTAMFGRWIVDCGHDDFHTEIHPPLLSVVGYATSDDRSDYTIEGRPFLTSQYFNGKTWWTNAHDTLRDANIACLFVPPVFPCPFNVDWSATMLPPFSGTTTMVFYIRPSSPRPSSVSTMKLRGRVYIRRGVTFEASPRDDAYQVVVTMNGDEYQVPTVAPYDGRRPYSLADLGNVCLGTGDGKSDECLFFGLQANLEALWISLHPLTPDNYASYRSLDIARVWADELANQPTAPPDIADFQVLPAKASLYPIQGMFSVEWEGRPTGRALALSPRELDFATRNSQTAPVALRSIGTAAVQIRSVAIEGTHAADFMLADGCTGRSLSPGATCEATITYTASGFGARTATLRIDDDADGAPHLVPLAGPGWVTMR